MLGGGTLMIGVKVVDEEALRAIIGGSEDLVSGGVGAKGPTTNGNGNGGTSTPARGPPSGVGKPVHLLGPSSAFKVAAPTPPRRGLFSGLGMDSSSSGAGGADPHASLFAEKNRQAILAQNQGAPKGVLGKVSDAIFGW